MNGKNFAPQRANGPVHKASTARTRRTKLGLVERSDQGSGITTGTAEATPLFAQPGLFMTKAYTIAGMGLTLAYIAGIRTLHVSYLS